MPQAAVDKEWKKVETVLVRQLGKVNKQGRRCSGSTKRRKDSLHCYTDGYLSSQECGVRTPISDVHGSSRAPRRHCEDDSVSCAIFTEQGSSASQMTAAKSDGYF